MVLLHNLVSGLATHDRRVHEIHLQFGHDRILFVRVLLVARERIATEHSTHLRELRKRNF